MKIGSGLLILVLGGCTLVDQTTFDPHTADVPVIPPAPVAAVARPQVGPVPLLVIAGGDPSLYRATLERAVGAARARKPGVVFDVVEMQPPDLGGSASLGSSADAVAKAIIAAGVPAGQIRLAARPEDGVRAGEVRVYVR